MSQNYTVDCYDANHAVNTDMLAIEANSECLRTQFSGSTAPSNPIAGMPWAHAGGSNGLRLRDSSNAAWLAVILGDATFKIWLYRNDAAPGMQIDSTVADRVLSLKGGAQAYNVDGGTTGGSWTITGLSATSAGSHAHSVATYDPGNLNYGYKYDIIGPGYGGPYDIYSGAHGHTATSAGAHGHTVSHDGTSRPAAAVGTLQKPVLS